MSANSADEAALAGSVLDSVRRFRNSIVPIAALSRATSAAISRRSSRATCSRNSIATATRNSTATARKPMSYSPSLGGSGPVASVIRSAPLTTPMPAIPRPSERALRHAS